MIEKKKKEELFISEGSNALEFSGINIKNEKSLHSSLKQYYCKSGDRLEVKLDGFIIDIVRGELLIEIQTKNFSALKNKLIKLTETHKLKLVYPIAVEKYITLMDSENNKISRRKSPKRGRTEDVFNELIRIPYLIEKENFSLEILLIKEEEIRCQDGKGSWRRKGVSLIDRQLSEVVETITLASKEDFLRFLPATLPDKFTNKMLAKELGLSAASATKITYCLRNVGLIKVAGKSSRELLYELETK